MLQETGDETTRIKRNRHSTEIYKNYRPLKNERYEDSKSEVESFVSMQINNDSSENISFPLDRKFFTDEYTKYSNDGEESLEPSLKNLSQKDLVHIIQTLHGPTKKKQIKVEEIFEIENKQKPVRKSRMVQKKRLNSVNSKENRFFSTSGTSTSKYRNKAQENIPVTSKSHPNSHIHQDNRSKNHKNVIKNSTDHLSHLQSDAQMSSASMNKKSRKSTDKLKPYMLDTKSRREIKDFEQYLNRKNSLLIRKKLSSCNCKEIKTTKLKKPSFEVKYISSDFVRTSDLSLPETSNDSSETLKSSEVMEKFQTEPKVKNTSFFKSRMEEQISQNFDFFDREARERDLYEFFEEYPKLMSSNNRTSNNHSVFDKLRGDERDLPGIYSRFVRRSKGVNKKNSDSNIRSLANENSDFDNCEFNVDHELEDHIIGELIKEKPLNDRLLELINKNPLKLEKKFKENIRNRKSPNRKEGIQDISLPAQEKKEDNIIVKRKLKCSTNSKPLEQKKSEESQNQIPKNNKKISNKRPSKKILKSSQVKLDKSDHIVQERCEQRYIPVILTNDPIKENLNMSPTTAITMMVLAADKVLAGKTEFFGKANRKMRS